MTRKWVLLFSIIIFLCATALILYNYKWTKKIEVTLQGTQFQLGTNEDGLQTAVKLHGILKKSWNGFKSFQGTVEVEGEAAPTAKYNQVITIIFNDDGDGPMIYDYWKNGTPYLMQYGTLFTNEDMSKLVITPFYATDGSRTNGWSGDNGRLIVAPTRDKQEGLKIAKELMKGFIQDYQLQ
jgi:hypothetical protein